MDFPLPIEPPVVEKIGGLDITFPVLAIDDYKDWTGTLTKEMRERETEKLTKLVGDPRRGRVLDLNARIEGEQRIESLYAGLGEIAPLIWTIDGATKVLTLSLTKAGVSEADRQQIIQRVKPWRLHSLAAQVSGLFYQQGPVIPQTRAEGEPDPNSNSGENGKASPADVAATGS